MSEVMPVYFIQSGQVNAGKVRITGDLARHLRDVLRVREGEGLNLVDELRRRYRVSLESVSPDGLTGGVLEVTQPSPSPSREVTLAQGILKKPKMDWVVQKATELGVSKIIPLVTERTVIRPDTDRIGRQEERWRKIATEAAQQCGRSTVPEIGGPVDWAEPRNPALEADHRIVLWERERGRPLRAVLGTGRPFRTLLVAVGPEGGFSSGEIEKARGAGYDVAGLGERVLRSETAVIAALSVIQYELGDLA
jgi:16S rRNA (uracil1498-N3)-methyltransferase